MISYLSRTVAGAALSASVLICATPAIAFPQSADHAPGASTDEGRRESLPLPFRGGPWVTGVNVWAGTSVATLTASHNEPFDGSLSLLGVQLTRTLFQYGGVQFTWIVEVLPVMLATSGAPANRVPTLSQDPAEASNPQRLSRYRMHDTYGFGFAPLSAEASRRLSDRLTAVLSTTSGVALFSGVVPYGKATSANFTVSPALMLEWQATRTSGVAVGYTLHHISNMSFGGANPGMNSHMFFVRVARERHLR
jgi:hypothetical protein